MTEPPNEKLTRSLNQLIEEHGVKNVLKGLASHCKKESDFLRRDRSTDLANNWQKLGEKLQDVVEFWGS